jgi:hypothetical protein
MDTLPVRGLYRRGSEMHVPKRQRRALQASFYTHKMILPQSGESYRVVRTYDEQILPVSLDDFAGVRSAGKYFRKAVHTGNYQELEGIRKLRKANARVVRMKAKVELEFDSSITGRLNTPKLPPMQVATRPQDWAQPARDYIFGAQRDRA